MAAGRIAPAAADLLAVTDALWLHPAQSELVHGRHVDDGRQVVREFIFVPNAARPRLLIPGRPPAASASALQRYSHALSPTERVGRIVAAALLRSGVADRLLTDRLRISQEAGAPAGPSVERRLAILLGQEVIVSLGLGNRRANQKPVLHVLNRSGRALAFVKVGDSPVAKALISDEALALAKIAALRLRRVRVPEVLALSTWNGLELLILSPLPTTPRRRRSRDHVPFEAIDEVSRAAGVSTAALRDSGFWWRLRGDAAELRGTEAGTRLSEAVATVDERHGAAMLDFGAWHGDWTAWNMSWEAGGLSLWDWERFEIGVPLGFDALHYQLRLDIARMGEAQSAGEQLRRCAPQLLARLGVPTDRVELTLSLYLLKLCTRFSLAARGTTGEPLLPRARWLLNFVCDQPARL
ncbi:MAG: phosphotransferase [Nocardioidaceae bacterium]